MFQKATKKQAKLRLAIAGPSGSGKTYSALRIATGIGGKIAFIDSENKTACKYADKFNFDVDDTLTNVSPISEFIKRINSASDAGYTTLVIDSMSHCWESLLDEIEKVAKAKYSGNTFAAWKDKAGGHLQSDLINAILKSKCHIIACFRVRTDWVVEPNDKGKMTPKRVGMSVKQKEGIEYEFDMFMEGNVEHYFNVSKDRTGKYQDAIIEKPGEDLGKELVEWLSKGEIQPEEKTPVVINASDEKDPVILIANCKNEAELTLVWNSFDKLTKAKHKDLVAKTNRALKEVGNNKPDEIKELINGVSVITPENELDNISNFIDAVDDAVTKLEYLEFFKKKISELNIPYEVSALPF